MRSFCSGIAVPILASLVIGCGSAGSAGPEGPPGPAGEAGAPGSGISGDGGITLTGSISGTVTAAVDGKPLSGAAITGSPGMLTATTASDGTFQLKALPVGAYTLSVTRTGYLATTVAGVGVSTLGPTSVTVAMPTDGKSTDGLAIVLNSNLLAGYGAATTLTAQVTATDTDAAALKYTWQQTGGIPTTFTGAGTTSINFTTTTLAAVKLEGNPTLTLGTETGLLVPARFGGMGISPDESGNYGFQLTVTDPEGHSASASATVQATAPCTGLGNLPTGLPAYFQGDSIGADGGAMTSWSWTLDTSGATGSTATLQNASTQFPSFTPDVTGTYGLTETVSGKTMTIFAGQWLGISGGGTDAGDGNDYAVQGCTGCHNGPTTIPYAGTPYPPPDMFTPWSATEHAVAFSSYVDGLAGQEFGPACLSCHTLGDSTLANNDGFGNVATKDGWTYPAVNQPGNYVELVTTHPDLAQLANVQCESCHGPQKSTAHPLNTTERISDSEEVCATCHGSEPFNYKAAQWKTSPHANLSIAMSEGSVDKGPEAAHCGRCHSAEGYSQYSQQLAKGYTGLLTSDGNVATFDAGVQTNAATTATLTALGMNSSTIHSQTCVSCHDPHNTPGNPAQLRLYDVLPGGLPNGQGAISGVGAGAVCMACHNTRNGETDDTTAGTLSATSAIGRGPHLGPQTDTLFGVNAYFMGSQTSYASPHLAVADTCVGCHYAIPNAAEADAGQTSDHAFLTDTSICTTCHGTGSSLVDGKALQGDMQAQMATLDTLIFQKMADAMAAAVTANASFVATAQDTVTGNYLCAAASAKTPTFTFMAAPSASTITEPQPVQKWRALNTIWFVVPSLADTTECTSAGALATTTYNGSAPLSVALGGMKTGAAGAYVFPLNGIVAKATSNEALIHNDESWGIHNLPFTQAVIANTTTALNTLP